MTRVPVRRALLSVWDKTGLVELGRVLADHGAELVASGGTAAVLSGAGLPVTEVAAVTSHPEILGGRVKTLHPRIHGGILARPGHPGDEADLASTGIESFQLVVVDLYPFRQAAARPGAGLEEVIEQIDIGGPAMVRAAAKNHEHVAVVTSPGWYPELTEAVREGGPDRELRRRLALEAFRVTASYDAAIATWMGADGLIDLERVAELRYGENPHQPASLWVERGKQPWWAQAVQHQGKPMSFNNYADAEAAWCLANDLEGGAVVVKHTNPCGAAWGRSAVEAIRAAWECDPLSAFGGVVALGRPLDEEASSYLAERFVEVVVCPAVSGAALRFLQARPGLRVLTAPPPHRGDRDMRRIEDGFLIQERDRVEPAQWSTVSNRAPTEEEWSDLEFAWMVAGHSKSNAVVVATRHAAVGVGAGDQSRVGAAQRALARAGERARGAVAASDGFFPFRDGLDALAEAGITAVAQPGGSRNDAEVVAAADQHGVAMVFTGSRHFRH